MENKISISSELEFIKDGEAFSSVSLNPYFQWAKIVITDDLPNANKQKIPESEFDNMIRTGIHTPIKMAIAGISEGHEEAFGKPIGVLAHIVKESNKLIGLAALWKKERPEDIELLKKMYQDNKPPQVSWEVSFAEAKLEDDVEVLLDTSLNGLAVVGMPAYQGRTPIAAFASIEGVNDDVIEAAKLEVSRRNDLPDSAFLYIEPGGDKDADGKTTPRSLRHLPYRNAQGKVDPVHLRNAISRLSQSKTGSVGGESWLTESLRQTLLAKARKLLNANSSEGEETLDELEKLQAEVAELKQKLAEAEPKLAELDELRQYKEAAEAAKAEVEKLQAIQTKFKEASIEKDEKYWQDNRELLLGLSEAAIDFMIQEMVAFASNKSDEDATASDKNKNTIPPMRANLDSDYDLSDPRELARAFKALKAKE